MSLTRRDLLWLFLLALAVNAGAAVLIRQPAYMDAYYYFDGALQLARGQGFSEPYLWNYLAPVRGLPAPSHLYWMPLTSIVAAPFIWLAEWGAGRPLPNDVLFRAAQVSMALSASALPLLSYAVADAATGVRRHAVGAALLTLFSAFYFPFWTTTDSFALFGLAAGGSLSAYARAAGRMPPAHRGLFLSGALAGLAHLARADGVLVLACLALFHVFEATGSRRPAAGKWMLELAWLIGGYLLVMVPWFLRNLIAVGAPLAPNGARTLWLASYAELFTYTPEKLTLARYLARGWAQIVGDKWQALGINLQRLVAEQASIVAFPFMLLGGWQLRRQRLFQVALLYGAGLFAAMTVAFTFPGPLGGYFHSGTAWLPFVYPAALVGLDVSVEAIARRLRHWQPEKSKPVFTMLLVAGVIVLTLARFVSAAPSTWRADAVYGEIGAWLDSAIGPEGGAVAVNNPPAFYYHTGRPAIVIPGDDVGAVLQAMDDFGARWLVLDVNVAPGVMPLYAAPSDRPGLALRATFRDGAGRDVYMLEREP